MNDGVERDGRKEVVNDAIAEAEHEKERERESANPKESKEIAKRTEVRKQRKEKVR